jgi:hypothetical protein
MPDGFVIRGDHSSKDCGEGRSLVEEDELDMGLQ